MRLLRYTRKDKMFLYFGSSNKKMPEFPPIILFAIPFFILAMLLELYITTKRNIKTYTKKDAFSSIAMGLGNVFFRFFQ